MKVVSLQLSVFGYMFVMARRQTETIRVSLITDHRLLTIDNFHVRPLLA